MATKSDEIREFVPKNYVEPARKSGQKRITVVAGDIHTKLGFGIVFPWFVTRSDQEACSRTRVFGYSRTTARLLG